MSRNLGATSLRRRARSGDPMRSYDALAPELRRWMAQAALPWSARSCARLWDRARRQGLGPNYALAALSRAERRQLERDRLSTVSWTEASGPEHHCPALSSPDGD
ncbi:DUF6525 family protein [Aestuariibius insulae]|uniref:DUF6525 family protein n=1 Tax=Aestuariibius insulae TaxID=2058287 RepID=UPI00345E2FFD